MKTCEALKIHTLPTNPITLSVISHETQLFFSSLEMACVQKVEKSHLEQNELWVAHILGLQGEKDR